MTKESTTFDAADFKQNYFEIFQFEVDFQVDPDALSERYRELQLSVHPDKFANATEHVKRLSMQWATQINSAYNTLKVPLSRAIYLLELNGIKIASNPILDPVFLLEQIELREELEDIESKGEAALALLDDYKQRIGQTMSALLTRFGAQFRGSDAAQSEGAERKESPAEHTVYEMQFVNKLLIAADHLEEKLLDY